MIYCGIIYFIHNVQTQDQCIFFSSLSKKGFLADSRDRPREDILSVHAVLIFLINYRKQVKLARPVKWQRAMHL